MTEREPAIFDDPLVQAQIHRADVRAAFFDVLLDQFEGTIPPDELAAMRARVRQAGAEVSKALNRADGAIVDRVSGIVGTEQVTRDEQITQLRRELAELRARFDAGSEP